MMTAAVAALVFRVCPMHAAADPAVVTWVSAPALPNTTVMLKWTASPFTGIGLPQGVQPSLLLCPASAVRSDRCVGVAPLLITESLAVLRLPEGERAEVWRVFAHHGEFGCAAASGRGACRGLEGATELCRVNDATVGWLSCAEKTQMGSAPLTCVPGRSEVTVFGRALGFGPRGGCPDQAPVLGPRQNETVATLMLVPVGGGAPTVLAADPSATSCFVARFWLPPAIPPGDYKWSVKNGLEGSVYAEPDDASVATLRIEQPPKWPAPGKEQQVAAGDVAGLKRALQPASFGEYGGTVSLPPGLWLLSRLDRLAVPDGVVLRGAGSNLTVLEWPQQDSGACLTTGWARGYRVPLLGGPPTGAALGFAVEDLTIRVAGGMVQSAGAFQKNPATCAVVRPCSAPGCAPRGMALQRVRIEAIAPGSGVDVNASGVGMGALIEVLGSANTVRNCTLTHDGNCGSNVTPLLAVSGSEVLIARNRIQFGCTLYSVRSAVKLLILGNDAVHYGGRGRDGTVFAVFGPPMRLEHIALIGNRQVDNPEVPHRLEGFTLDGGGGAYTGAVASVRGTEITLASAPYGPGTGSYDKQLNRPGADWSGAAMLILRGRGTGQWRRVNGSGSVESPRRWSVERPWDVEPDGSSLVQIAPLRGTSRRCHRHPTGSHRQQAHPP